MRVLFVSPLGELGGSERSLLDLLAAFEDSGLPLEKKLLLFSDGELREKVRALGIDVEVLEMPDALLELGESKAQSAGRSEARRWLAGGLALLPYVRAFRRSVHSFSPTLLHTNGMKAHVLGALATPRLPLVIHMRDFASERPVARRVLGLVERRALVVTNSSAVAEDARSVASKVRTRVVYNGIDVRDFRPRPRDLESLARLSGLSVPSPETVTIGLVATYAWWKGHRTFLDAARQVRDQAALPTRFYVVGGAIYRTSGSEITKEVLSKSIRDAGLERDVGLVPFQSDAASVYGGLDVVVQASERREPFGRTIVEAMASGRAVVVARAGGAVELFEEGRTGLGFDPGRSEDLARAVLQLVRDAALRSRLATRARAEAEARFDRVRLAPEVYAAYIELLEGKEG
jgi:glycosyltransferase involved in cell wall biosynthesis